MKLIRKLKCRLGFHDNDLIKIIIQPVIRSNFKELNNFKLPINPGHMWKCKHCDKEKIFK